MEKQKPYKRVFDMACAELLRLDIGSQAENGGAEYCGAAGGGSIECAYFDEIISIGIPEFSFKSSKNTNVSLVTRIIILHYLITASGAPPGTDLISYEDIPGARLYLPVFEKRVTKPLLSAFGFNRDAFLDAGLALGGAQEEYGNASFTLHPLPSAPITFILWEGDVEFPPSMKILFSPSIPGYLPLEDVVVLSKLAAQRIVKAARMKYYDE